MTPEELAEIEVRADAATPGPWRMHKVSPAIVAVDDEDRVIEGVAKTDNASDAAFIIAARADVPRLVARVRHLEKRQAELLEAMVKVTRETPYPEEADMRGKVGALMAKVGTLRAALARVSNLLREAGLITRVEIGPLAQIEEARLTIVEALKVTP